MAFTGKWTLDKVENFEEFAANAGATPEQIAKAKSITPWVEITAAGDKYTVAKHAGDKTVTESFTLGSPGEMTVLEGKKVSATVTVEGGKMIMKGDNFHVVAEMVGDKMKETMTLKGVTMVRWSKRS